MSIEYSFNGKTSPKKYWRWRSKIDPKAWEYYLGVGHAILANISVNEIPDNANIQSGYWTKTNCGIRACGCRVPKWVTVKLFKAKDLKLRVKKVLTYEA